MRIEWSLFVFESPSPKDALCQVLLKLIQWFWRSIIFYFVEAFSLFRSHFPLERGTFLWTNLNVLTYGCFAPILVDIGMVVHEKKIFIFCQCSSSILLLSPFGKEQGPLFEKEMNSLHPRMLCVGFGWNWPSGSGERFLDFFNVLLLFHYYLPCKRAWPFIWTNLNPTHPRMLYVKFDWNWPSGSGEEFLIFPQCIQTLDKRWSEKLTWAFSSGELKNVSWERLHPRYIHNKNITIFEVSNTTCSFTQSHVLKVWNMVWFIKMVQFHFQIS